MPENAPYPGSSSLSPEAREKVLQTFHHTLQLARSGRNEEALLGCDFILKMDLRFVPARQLLDSLRGVAAGKIIDLSPFDEVPVSAPRPAPATPAPAEPTTPAPPTSAPPDVFLDGVPTPRPGSAPAKAPAPTPATAVPSGLDALGFDDLGDPFAALPPPSFGSREAPLKVDTFVGARSSAAPEAPGEAVPDLSFDSPLDAGEAGAPPPTPGAAPPTPWPSSPPAASAGASAPASATDPRVLQFLKQGDDAMARGQTQEAIDLWSRVFLIDLSNDQASSRIDAAREKQAQTAQAIDVLLSEGIQLFDSRDLVAARSKFLDVLALSETDSTARSYLNQIENSLSQKESAPSSFGEGGSDFLAAAPAAATLTRSPEAAGFRESPLGTPDEADFGLAAEKPLSSLSQVAAGPAKQTIKLDVRLILVAIAAVVVAVAGGTWYFFGKKEPPAPPPAAAKAPGGVRPPTAEDPITKAQALFNQGKADEAIQILVSVPDTDARHTEALGLIDKFKSSAVPLAAAPPPSAAAVDEMRISGLAAMQANRYIEAVKALDPVVKARPDDVEAAQALSRAREHLAALASAVRSYNEQDYESAIKLLWEIRKKDTKNQDVEEFLFKSYFNEGIQDLQAGNARKATLAFQEAVQLRQADAEASRHLKFARKYGQGTNDLLSRIYVKYATPRP